MINFLKYRMLCALFSLVIFSTFIGMFVYRYQTQGHAFNYSVDFTGGTQILFRFSKPVNNQTLIDILEKSGWKKPILRNFGTNEILVRVKEFSNDVKGLGEKMRTAIEQTLPENTVEILSIDSVGPGVGSELRYKSIQAIIIALLAMLAYIWFRFWSISFGVGAIVSLFHDAVVILLCFLILNKEISINVIGAILATLGYSINDTIVIFSRIRENLKTMGGVPITEVVNVSLNQTFRRTLLTSISTALVVISLIILGGETLRDLSLALLVGIIFGTYSSIYIASPIMLLLYREKK